MKIYLCACGKPAMYKALIRGLLGIGKKEKLLCERCLIGEKGIPGGVIWQESLNVSDQK
jgi:NAD(P)H-flavin reductase